MKLGAYYSVLGAGYWESDLCLKAPEESPVFKYDS